MDVPAPGSPEMSIRVAHLLYTRGDLPNARSVLEDLLTAEPGNEEARDLLDVVERAAVDRALSVTRSECWLSRYQPSIAEFLALAVLGVLSTASGVWMACGPVTVIAKRGLSAMVRYATGPVTTSPAPVHFMLLLPIMLLSFGAFLLHGCTKHVLSLRKLHDVQ
jgi:hypothetical protein